MAIIDSNSKLRTFIILLSILFCSAITPSTVSAQNVDDANLIPIVSLLLRSDSGPLRFLSPDALLGGTLAQFYNQEIRVAGGIAPYQWSVTGTFLLPSGLTLDTSSGYISGFPRTVGSNTFKVKVTDSENSIIEKDFSLGISPLTQSGSPAPPNSLTTITLGSDRIGLDWIDNSDNEEYFEIERSNSVTDFIYYDRWSGGVSVDDYPLPADTHYCYRVRAHNTFGDSSYTNISCKWTNATTIPRAPTNLVAQAVSAFKILLTWKNNSQSDQYDVYESVNGGAYVFAGTVPQDNVPGAYIGDGLGGGNTYSYKITAHNSYGSSAPSSESNTVSTPVLATTTFLELVNNTSYPIISLTIDGVEQFPQAPQGIPPGTTHSITVTTGEHTYRAVNGFWNGSSRFEMYAFQDSWTQTSFAHTVTINNPSITQLLTKFSASGYYLGETWEGTSFHHQGFRFYSNGTYSFYKDNLYIGSGTYALSSYPGSYTVTFTVSGSQTATGYYDELGGNFMMKNGPSGWSAVRYLEAGN